MRRPLLLLPVPGIILLATFAPPVERPRDLPPKATWVDYTPVPINRTDPSQQTVGALTLLGGWQLTSNDRRFGGISAMQVHAEGRQLLAFSDTGSVIAVPLPSGPRRVPATVGELPQGPGSASRKGDRDVEAIATVGPLLWTAYERTNQVWRYDRRDWRAASAAKPPGMKAWVSNRGGEAMLRLPDGRFLIFAEGPGGPSEVLLFTGDPAVKGTRAERLLYRPPAGFRITDATMLPDGRILFLNRRLHFLHGLGAKLTVAPLSAVKAGAVIVGRELADLRPPLTVDNMEALSVTMENGRTIVWMASDDNFGPLQMTLLLKFALEG